MTLHDHGVGASIGSKKRKVKNTQYVWHAILPNKAESKPMTSYMNAKSFLRVVCIFIQEMFVYFSSLFIQAEKESLSFIKHSLAIIL